MNSNQKLILLTISISFLLILFSLNIVSYFFFDNETQSIILNFFIDYHVVFMFIVTILSLVLGAFSYFIISKELVENKKYKRQLMNEFIVFFESKERKILEYLIQNNGITTQYELQHITKLNKVSLHRLLDKLESRRIIEKKKIGKINKIFLNKVFL